MSYETASELNAKFLAAAAKGDLAEVEACRNRGADPDQARAQDGTRNTVLHVAALNGHAHVVKYLLEDRADARLLDEEEETALMRAIRRNDTAIVQTYIDCDVSVDAENYAAEITPLTIGAVADAADAIKVLLTSDVKPGRADTHGKTAIMWAAENNSANAFDVLVAAGADPCAPTNTGKTALDFAKAAGAVKILAKLESFFPDYGAQMAAQREALAMIALTDATVQSMTDGTQERIGVLRPLRLKGPGG